MAWIHQPAQVWLTGSRNGGSDNDATRMPLGVSPDDQITASLSPACHICGYMAISCEIDSFGAEHGGAAVEAVVEGWWRDGRPSGSGMSDVGGGGR